MTQAQATAATEAFLNQAIDQGNATSFASERELIKLLMLNPQALGGQVRLLLCMAAIEQELGNEEIQKDFHRCAWRITYQHFLRQPEPTNADKNKDT